MSEEEVNAIHWMTLILAIAMAGLVCLFSNEKARDAFTAGEPMPLEFPQ